MGLRTLARLGAGLLVALLWLGDAPVALHGRFFFGPRVAAFTPSLCPRPRFRLDP